MGEILFDSGFDAAADSLAYPVALILKPYTCYYWTVTVRSEAGEEAAGAVQWFETAKLQEAWSGKWITCDSAEKRHPFFEKDVQVDRPVKGPDSISAVWGCMKPFIRRSRGTRRAACSGSGRNI